MSALGLDQVSEEVRVLVFVKNMAVADAVDSLGSLVLTEDCKTFLIRRGLISYANDQISAARGGNGNGWVDRNGNRKKFASSGLSALEISALLIRHQASDGSMKPLADFDAVDWLEFRALCEREVAGWSKRGAVARWAIRTLATEGKAVVRELDLGKQKEFAQKVEEAWGDD